MSRSGYTDDSDDNWQLIMYRGRVASATRGKRGQTLLRELLEALDAMPEKRLVANEFEAEGAFCTLGVIGAKRGVDLKQFNVEDDEYDPRIGEAFDIAGPLAREIMWLNDQCIRSYDYEYVEVCGPMRSWDRREIRVRIREERVEERRWQYMRDWVSKQIKAAP